MRLENPYGDLSGGDWLRGNLHCHTTRSDGTAEPQAAIDEYARRGYGFLMISDHDIYTTPEDHARLNARGLILIPGNEISANGPHMLHVGADRLIAPSAQRQEVLNQVAGTSGTPGKGFLISNHPNWTPNFDHCSIQQLREWVGLTGIEIFNGVICRLDGSPYASGKWDMLLGAGRRVWGFANDDMHDPAFDVALGWSMAYVKDRTAAGIVDALKRGRFYASSGVTVSAIKVDGMKVRVDTKDAQRIVAIVATGKRLTHSDAASIEVTVPPDAGYIRFECWGAGERFAWTQPMFVVQS